MITHRLNTIRKATRLSSTTGSCPKGQHDDLWRSAGSMRLYWRIRRDAGVAGTQLRGATRWALTDCSSAILRSPSSAIERASRTLRVRCSFLDPSLLRRSCGEAARSSPCDANLPAAAVSTTRPPEGARAGRDRREDAIRLRPHARKSKSMRDGLSSRSRATRNLTETRDTPVDHGAPYDVSESIECFERLHRQARSDTRPISSGA